MTASHKLFVRPHNWRFWSPSCSVNWQIDLQLSQAVSLPLCEVYYFHAWNGTLLQCLHCITKTYFVFLFNIILYYFLVVFHKFLEVGSCLALTVDCAAVNQFISPTYLRTSGLHCIVIGWLYVKCALCGTCN